MGKRNRERRAAKQRARRREQAAAGRQRWSGAGSAGGYGGGPYRAGSDGGYGGGPHRAGSDGAALLFELAQAQLLAAAHAHACGDAVSAGRCAAELTSGRFGAEPRRVDAAADMVVRQAVRQAAEGGWLPVDLYEVTRRRLDSTAAAYVLDAVAAYSDAQAAGSLAPRWTDQLDQVDADLWWSGDRPHLPQWAMRHGQPRLGALTLVIHVVALVGSLRPFERAATPPPASTTGVDEKILARVRALLAKAESTEFADEAEALSAKAQELMSRYSLHRAMVEHDRGVAQRPTARRIWLDNPYINAKASLVNAVAGANRCRTVFSDLGFITAIGHEVDLDIVELLSTSLLVQATQAMTAAGRQVDRRSNVSRTRSFRQSFLVAYASRIRERLRAATQAQADTTDSSRLLPALAARSRAVDELFEALFPTLVHKSLSVSNAAGWGAGRAAADLARLDVLDAVEAPGA